MEERPIEVVTVAVLQDVMDQLRGAAELHNLTPTDAIGQAVKVWAALAAVGAVNRPTSVIIDLGPATLGFWGRLRWHASGRLHAPRHIAVLHFSLPGDDTEAAIDAVIRRINGDD